MNASSCLSNHPRKMCALWQNTLCPVKEANAITEYHGHDDVLLDVAVGGMCQTCMCLIAIPMVSQQSICKSITLPGLVCPILSVHPGARISPCI